MTQRRTPEGLAAAVFIAVVLLCTTALAGTAVRVTPDRNAMRLGETLSLEIVMEGDFDDMRGPEMPDFQVVGRSSGSSISIINGTVSRQQRLSLGIAPSRAGDLVIGKVELLKGGRTVASSAAVKIRVSDDGSGGVPQAQQPPQDPPSQQDQASPSADSQDDASGSPEPAAPMPSTLAIPQKFAGKQAFILARLPNRPMYAGEPVFLEYVLYTRSDLPLAGLRLQKAPVLKGFIVENTSDDSENARPIAIGGRRYDERVLWRAAVTAIDPGIATVDPITIDVVVGDLFSKRRYTLASDPVTADFMEVPAAGRPADYIPGTIGTFIVNATLDKPVVKVGESAILTVEIAGSGNLRALKPPKISEPDGLRVDRVASSDLDEMRVDRGGVSGRKVFQFMLTPRKEGDFDLGRIDVPYFSNVNGAFDRARSDRITFKAAGFSATGRPIEAKRDMPALGIIGDSSLSAAPAVTERGLEAPTLALLMAAPVLVFGMAEAFYRRRAHLVANSRVIAGRKALRKAVAELNHLGRHSPEGQPFWDGLESIIRRFLDARFGFRAASMTPGELAAALRGAGADDDATTSLLNELESCAFARFAPARALDSDRTAALARVEKCLSDLDRTRGGAAA